MQLQCNTLLEGTKYYKQFSCLHNYNNMLKPVQTSDAMCSSQGWRALPNQTLNLFLPKEKNLQGHFWTLTSHGVATVHSAELREKKINLWTILAHIQCTWTSKQQYITLINCSFICKDWKILLNNLKGPRTIKKFLWLYSETQMRWKHLTGYKFQMHKPQLYLKFFYNSCWWFSYRSIIQKMFLTKRKTTQSK